MGRKGKTTLVVAEKKQPRKKSKRGRKTRKGVKKAYGGGVHQLLKNTSVYLQSLLHPGQILGVKIPDTTFFPSSTVRTLDRFQLVVNANGCAGIYFVAGRPTNIVTTATAAATPSAFTWNALSSISAVTSMTGIYDKVRLVSGGLFASYSGTTLNNSGKCIVANWPRGTQNFTAGSSASVFATTATSNVVPVAQGYFQALWLPSDYDCFNYLGSATATGEAGTVLMIFTGMVATQTIEVNLILNWECIANYNTFSLVTPSPSKSDAMEMDVAMNAIAESPLISTDQTHAKSNVLSTTPLGSQSQQMTQPHPAQSQTLFERILGGAEKTLGFAEKAAPFVAKYAPMAMAAFA